MTDEPQRLTIDTVRQADQHVVRLSGEVDLRSSPQLRNVLLDVLAAKPRRLIVDLAQVGYMDSSGVGTLVEIKRLIERGAGQIVLAGLQPRVRSVFEITQLDKFFRIAASVDEVGRE
jgi:anti-sigma B factor antagonist